MGADGDGVETETGTPSTDDSMIEVPDVVHGDISAWLETLDEGAVTKVLEAFIPTEAEAFSLADVARTTGYSTGRIRLFWQALGFPHLADDATQLTAQDVELMSTFASFFIEKTHEQGVGLQMARVLGSNIDRIASAQVDSLVARVLLSGPAAEVAAERSRLFADLMPRLMELTWRRHLANASRTRLLRPTVGDTATVCIGFADMVGFTAASQKLNQLELARVVGFFEARAYEVVAAGGGRVVKTIGDEVMFMAEDAKAGASIAMDLAQKFHEDEVLPDVHVGLASGPVVQRRGDVYGPTVNLAARIVSVALSGTVLVSDEIHAELVDDPAFEFRSSYDYELDGIGKVTLWRMRRPGLPGAASKALLAADDTWRNRFGSRWSIYSETIDTLIREQLESSAVDLPERVVRAFERGIGAAEVNELAQELSAEEVDALAQAILVADLEPDLQVDLLGELYATRELAELRGRADDRLAENDDVALQWMREAEKELLRRITEAEAEAREKVAAALRHAREETFAIDVDAQERVQELIERARKAEDIVRERARAKAALAVEQARRP